MSMHYYGEHGYGMFLNMDEAKQFCESYGKVNDIEAEDVPIELNLSELIDDSYDGRFIRTIACSDISDDFADGLFFYADRQGTIFDKPIYSNTKTTYSDITEMVDEFKNKYGKYLPSDFDYESHMVVFSGAVFC